jgi:hypothetical protein
MKGDLAPHALTDRVQQSPARRAPGCTGTTTQLIAFRVIGAKAFCAILQADACSVACAGYLAPIAAQAKRWS